MKSTLWAELDGHAPPSAIFASNTSSISIADLASAVGAERRPRFVGMHFFSPVPVMPLVELIRSDTTSDATLEAIRRCRSSSASRSSSRRIGRASSSIGSSCRSSPTPCALYEQGVGTAEDIDAGARVGLNHPMGPLELADFIGLDVCLGIMRVLEEDLGLDHVRAAAVLVDLVDGRPPRSEDGARVLPLPA